MKARLAIAGGGIGGLAAAFAGRRAGCEVALFEQAEFFSEVGAGIQMGPNVTAILREWGLLEGELAASVARPGRLRARGADDGRELAALALGAGFESRYGAPYLTVHRADLQTALLQAAREAGATLRNGARVTQAAQDEHGVHVAAGGNFDADALIGADGLWSSTRQLVVPADTPPRATGHLAYRAVVRQTELPAASRSTEVTAWLGAGLHVVSYPVRAGDWLNVVCVVEGCIERDPRSWDHAAIAADLYASTRAVCTPLRDLLGAVANWRFWVLHDRPVLRGPGEMAAGRVALLGDAAHPMLPYLAQGAGMAVEDARELQRVLQSEGDVARDLPAALQRYALHRWARCARVQARSLRNGRIFHLEGPMRAARDLSMRVMGSRLLDVPWLYGQKR
ncbi:MAG TPA: FAD-dependent monooxygenase [Ramlibacter sp.]|uniref:FAD-dependent monooxygenase n=1 Tax=Ramlibacter sp. TaxID=1917967 RepID=UPI002CBAF1D8|nr:FAD-dependent monooxygenase [Ramlibacter sp.]HVZ42759.1 FAD-dependent monooxygenase [Ramlibacter sp.]